MSWSMENVPHVPDTNGSIKITEDQHLHPAPQSSLSFPITVSRRPGFFKFPIIPVFHYSNIPLGKGGSLVIPSDMPFLIDRELELLLKASGDKVRD